MDAWHRPRRHRHASRGLNAASATRKARLAATWAARSSSSASGRGRTDTRRAFSANSDNSAARAIGGARASRWTTTIPTRCATTFFNWFRDGYIYRGKRLVNWDTQLQTSVADDETYDETIKGGFWTFKYQVIGEPGRVSAGCEFIRFSTTRPETMLGDVAVAVHPNDRALSASDRQDGAAAARRTARFRSSPTANSWTWNSAPAA